MLGQFVFFKAPGWKSMNFSRTEVRVGKRVRSCGSNSVKKRCGTLLRPRLSFVKFWIPENC